MIFNSRNMVSCQLTINENKFEKDYTHTHTNQNKNFWGRFLILFSFNWPSCIFPFQQCFIPQAHTHRKTKKNHTISHQAQKLQIWGEKIKVFDPNIKKLTSIKQKGFKIFSLINNFQDFMHPSFSCFLHFTLCFLTFTVSIEQNCRKINETTCNNHTWLLTLVAT